MKVLKNNTKNLGSSNENKEHIDFSELEDGELNHEVIPSVTKRSRFFTDAEKGKAMLNVKFQNNITGV